MRKSEEINESVGLCQYPAVSLSSHYKYKYSAVVPAAFSSFPARQEEGAAEDEIIQLHNSLKQLHKNIQKRSNAFQMIRAQ